jgi:branched-chain amino acid transport system permease protein
MSEIDFRNIVRLGLIAGIVAASVSVIGMVETFDERDIITGVLTLGQILLFSAAALGAYLASQEHEEGEIAPSLITGLLVGILAALPVIALIGLQVGFPAFHAALASIAPSLEAVPSDIRDYLVNLSPALIEILTFGREPLMGSLLLLGSMALLGVAGAIVHVVPSRFERPLTVGVLSTLLVGMLSEVLLGILRQFMSSSTLRLIFGTRGIKPIPALIIFVVVTVIAAVWQLRGRQAWQNRMVGEDNQVQRKRVRQGGSLVLFGFLLVLPFILGTYLTEVVDNVGLFILMGLGLNIVVGFAGLLDLGYVAFYAIGAYTMGILTSTGDLGLVGLSFWAALPIAMGASVMAGIILGTPVLRMRGDYLAIVTLGFGEIIRILAVSDLLKPYIGGAQGVLNIPKPELAGFRFFQPEHFYYLILAGCLFAAFVAWRLRDARLGRQWMAMREDEDVAEAMGIHLVKTKLLAFGMGAAFAGLAGAIFAAKLGSIFPNSFNLIISINVLSLIIVGGIGSLPGVVVGALVLVGMPELLREFAEYRFLMYGALLIAMMLAKPDGLWPSPIRRRELVDEGEVDGTYPSEEGLNPFTEEPMAEQMAERPNTAVK